MKEILELDDHKYILTKDENKGWAYKQDNFPATILVNYELTQEKAYNAAILFLSERKQINNIKSITWFD